MKHTKILYIIICVLTIAVGYLYFKSFGKQNKIAYVNNGVIMVEYKGMIDSRKEFELKTKGWQKNIDSLTQVVQYAIQEYEKKAANGTAREKQMAEELIQNKKKQMMQYQQAIQQKAQQIDKTLTQKEVEEINRYITEYGKDHGYSIIFGATSGGNIVYANDVMDITKDVLEGLNKNYVK